MCFDQSINNDVLKLVQDEMATLVKSVEDNKETWVQDHEGLRTNLQNIQQLFGIEIKNLEAKHTALKSGLQRLESRHELLETKVTGLSQGKEDEKDFLKSGQLTDGFHLPVGFNHSLTQCFIHFKNYLARKHHFTNISVVKLRSNTHSFN